MVSELQQDLHPKPALEPTDARGASLDQVVQVSASLTAAMSSVVEGKQAVIRTAITVLLAEGHLLIEDVPGVGKTLLAKTLARSIDCSVRRVQFTPDLLPSDITGISVFNQDVRAFEFRPGAVFANVVVGDEINRASPKTQSALLESMEEGQVTVDGTTYTLPRPFIVMATQNPSEMEGTYPLPEAQRDRFMTRISMGYPSAHAEMAMLDHHGGRSPLEDLHPVTDASTVSAMIAAVRRVHASPAVRQYAVDLAHATRVSPALRLGASPRATLHLLRAARAHAALAGRDHVLPDDVQHVAVAVLAHRLIPTGETQMAQHTTADVVSDLLHRVHVPAQAR
ncbi:MAG: AAA family ATPase [Dermatophilaceae bacterium]